MAEIAAHELVGDAGLAGSARAGDADHGNARWRFFGVCSAAASIIFSVRDGAGDPPDVLPFAQPKLAFDIRRMTVEREIALPDHVLDHPFQPHPPPVVRRIDPRNPVTLELVDLAGKDRAAAAAKDLDVAAAVLVQEILNVFEEFDVSSLVRSDGDALHVLFDSALDDFCGRSVVSEVDDLHALCLEEAAHYIDCGIVAIEKGSGGNDTDLIGRGIAHRLKIWRTGKITLKN